MRKIKHDAPDWMDAAIDEAAASLTRSEGPADLRRDVLARIDGRPRARRLRPLAIGAVSIAVVAIVGVLIVRNRPAAPRPLLASVAAAIEMAPLSTPSQGVASFGGALASAARVPTAHVVHSAAATLTMGRPAPATSVGDQALTVVQIARLAAPGSIDPAPLGSPAAVGTELIAIPPIDLRAIVLPPLGASQENEGDQP